MAERLEINIEELMHSSPLDEANLTEKQRAILTAAERLFVENGYDATATAEIAKEAGVTERTLFKHFRSKADLFKSVLPPLLLHTILPMQMKRVHAILKAKHSSFADFFETFAKDRWATANHFSRGLRLALPMLLHDSKFREGFGKLFAKNTWPNLLATLETFQREGKIRSDVETERIARMLIFLIAGQALLRSILKPDQNWNDEAEAKEFLKILLEGLAHKPEGKP